MDVPQAADYLRISKTSARKHIERQAIPAARTGRLRRVRNDELDGKFRAMANDTRSGLSWPRIPCGRNSPHRHNRGETDAGPSRIKTRLPRSKDAGRARTGKPRRAPAFAPIKTRAGPGGSRPYKTRGFSMHTVLPDRRHAVKPTDRTHGAYSHSCASGFQ